MVVDVVLKDHLTMKMHSRDGEEVLVVDRLDYAQHDMPILFTAYHRPLLFAPGMKVEYKKEKYLINKVEEYERTSNMRRVGLTVTKLNEDSDNDN